MQTLLSKKTFLNGFLILQILSNIRKGTIKIYKERHGDRELHVEQP